MAVLFFNFSSFLLLFAAKLFLGKQILFIWPDIRQILYPVHPYIELTEIAGPCHHGFFAHEYSILNSGRFSLDHSPDNPGLVGNKQGLSFWLLAFQEVLSNFIVYAL